MIQEIITYLIVASALAFAVYKISGAKKFKKKGAKSNKQKTSINTACSSCTADCSVRDALSGNSCSQPAARIPKSPVGIEKKD